MTKRLFMICLLSATLFSCLGQENDSTRYANANPIKIDRFDKELLAYIDSGDSSNLIALKNNYAAMLDIFGKGILNQRDITMPGFFQKLRGYFSEPTLRGLYGDAVAKYNNVEVIEKSLGRAFAFLNESFPAMQTPRVYMHVSGFNQNVLVGDSLLSISIDKYMGSDYPLYADFFYETQKRKMTPYFIVPDYIAGWIMSEYPFSGNERVLLDRIIYEGKIKYIVQKATGISDIYSLLCYYDKSIKWCEENEGDLWKAIIERKHLYTPDNVTTSAYFEDAGVIFTGSDVPWSIGTWIGWRIVDQYMKESGASIETLMKENDSQKILTGSKYKPF